MMDINHLRNRLVIKLIGHFVADQEEGGEARRAVHVPPGPGGLQPHLPPAAERPQQEVAPRLQPQGHLPGPHQGPGAAQGSSAQTRQVLRPQEVRF